jgi:hypothetical protein
MRITARQLRQIIREELHRGLREGDETEVEMPAVNFPFMKAPEGDLPPAALEKLNKSQYLHVIRIMQIVANDLEKPNKFKEFRELDAAKIGDIEHVKEALKAEDLKVLRGMVDPYLPPGNFPVGQYLNGLANQAAQAIVSAARIGMRADSDPAMQSVAATAASIRRKAEDEAARATSFTGYKNMDVRWVDGKLQRRGEDF